MSEDIKKVAPQELSDEDIDMVAGGAYTVEEWDAMTVEEKQAAQRRSRLAQRRGMICELD